VRHADGNAGGASPAAGTPGARPRPPGHLDCHSCNGDGGAALHLPQSKPLACWSFVVHSC